MNFRNAEQNEQVLVLALYQSAVGKEFCFWNESYPGMEEIRHDSETENLFVMTENGRIIGACSVVPENELDELSCWTARGEAVSEIARIVVAVDCRGRGIAAEMVKELLFILKARGARAVHLSCAAGNLPAQKTYKKLGFRCAGEADLYENHYFLLEKTIE